MKTYTNPVLKALEELTRAQKIFLMLAAFGLGAVLGAVGSALPAGPFQAAFGFLILGIGWVLFNLLVYLLISIQVQLAPRIRSLLATIFSGVSLVLFVAVIAVNLFLQSASGEPRVVMEHDFPGTGYSVEFVETDFDFFQGQDIEMYLVENGERKELVETFTDLHTLSLVGLDDTRFRLNGKIYQLVDGELRRGT